MKNFKSHFQFSKQERSGIFFLLLLIVLLQIGYLIFRFCTENVFQSEFRLDTTTQFKIDELKAKSIEADTVKIFPFNPNFISDYKGYTLGMSVDEIDRLHVFRQENNFVNSTEDFQKVTNVSDSLLNRISPYFKFPAWTKKSKPAAVFSRQKSGFKTANTKEKIITVKDLNKVTSEELKAINGVGEVLSSRIVKFRNRLGGFLVDEQLYDVYNLEPDVVKKILTKYKVFKKPVHEKININTASAYEISSLAYIKYEVAKKIVSHRLENGPFLNLNELQNITDFPKDKIDRIALYLSL